ncbi:hypothetical protein [Acanthopleuribacter pedis]|uniref:Uncharacterized protein n=1 Tax=Acanthopleuribacter pedis TaxID=442870 RepID=A0A8J7QM58_9BACT|nr:hypothetical protein [Acanthopleuribacter pedis]MBO1320530.1 hypothetical protein [Acanthopleuribacter pedis]
MSFAVAKGQLPSFQIDEYEIMNICRYTWAPGRDPFVSPEDLFTAPPDALFPLIDTYLKLQGFYLLQGMASSGWEEADATVATGVLALTMTHSLAYDVPRLSREAAYARAAAFVGEFSPLARFLLSSDVYDLSLEPDGFPPASWRGMLCGRGLTNWTFGVGQIAVDFEKIGVYWIQDED